MQLKQEAFQKHQHFDKFKFKHIAIGRLTIFTGVVTS